MTEVDDYAETILDHISQISGVANVEIGGQQKPAVRITARPDLRPGTRSDGSGVGAANRLKFSCQPTIVGRLR
jgi:hypothetical protein